MKRILIELVNLVLIIGLFISAILATAWFIIGIWNMDGMFIKYFIASILTSSVFFIILCKLNKCTK